MNLRARIFNVFENFFLKIFHDWYTFSPLGQVPVNYQDGNVAKLPVIPIPPFPITGNLPTIAAAHIEAHEPKPSSSSDVYTQYNLLKLLVGFK